MLNNYICALDIGSSKLAACVVEIRRKRLNDIYFETVPSKGIKAGAVVDSIDLVGCITKLVKHLKAKSGININSIYTNISGRDLVTRHSRAIVPLAEKGNKVISSSDIQRAIDQARILGSSLEDEIIHAIPFGYSIDSKDNIANPLGLYSHRLEVDLYLVCAKLSSLQSLQRAINQSGYEMKDMFFSGTATSAAVFDDELKEGQNIICDIGSDTTEILYFRDGLIKEIEILALGADNLTKDLQEALQIPYELAEDIKRSYGVIGDTEQIAEDKGILVKKSDLYKPIKQKMVSEIINASAKSICSKIKERIEKKFSLYQINNFVVVGRTVLLEGFIEMLESYLSVPVKLGRITNPEILSLIKEDSSVAGQKYLTYLTCLGLICQVQQEKTKGIFSYCPPAKNLLLKAADRIKEVYQAYF